MKTLQYILAFKRVAGPLRRPGLPGPVVVGSLARATIRWLEAVVVRAPEVSKEAGPGGPNSGRPWEAVEFEAVQAGWKFRQKHWKAMGP